MLIILRALRVKTYLVIAGWSVKFVFFDIIHSIKFISVVTKWF